jgi:hypothetical protein
MWITPVQKASYINSNTVIVQTLNKAIINPLSLLGASNRIYTSNFIIRYYTWSDNSNQPAIIANVDDYAFAKQDSSQLSGSNYLQYNTTSVTSPHHGSVSIS